MIYQLRHSANYTITQIAQLFKRSRVTVYRILQEDVGRKYVRAKKLTARQLRAITSETARNNTNIPKIKSQLNLQVSRNTIRSAIKGSHKYSRIVKKIELTATHRQARINFAHEHQHFTNWIFSEKKKFYLAGPDGCNKAWMLKGAERTFEVPNRCHGSVIVWGAISRTFKSDLQIIIGRLTAEDYCNLIRLRMYGVI